MGSREIKQCVCCGRQLVSYNQSDDRVAPIQGAVRMIGQQLCCEECAKDLDENGNFPEEVE